MRKIIFVSVLLVGGFLYYFLSPVLTDDKNLLEKLVFPEASDVGSGYNDQLKRTVISYKVELKYPSEKVLEFCNKKLEELGWQKKIDYTFERGDRGWMDFIDGTKEGEPFVHQLSASWNDKEKNKMVSLLLRYYSYYPTNKEKLYTEKPNNDVLNVIVQIQPYIDISQSPLKPIYSNKEKNVEIHGDNKTWSQSFQFYLSHIKQMSLADRDACKKLLEEILYDLDIKNNCKRDDECTLIDEGLLSTHLPFPHNSRDAISIKMKNYREQCHDGKTFIINYNDLIATPVCWKERCMVETGFRENSNR